MLRDQAATVVITTKNRKDELRVAVRSALAQTTSIEILVIDDGSTDGTAEMLRVEFPSVNLQRREESRGLIVRRNEAARLARGEILISIDDDAEFSAPDIVEATLRDFDDPRVAAVAIPFTDINKGPMVKQKAPPVGRWITNEYIGTAHAVRRDIFTRLGGYREVLVHQGEEGDFCIRLLDAGFVVRLGSAEPILHYESPKRSAARMNIYGQRNLMLFAWHNVPMPYLLVHLPATIWNGLVWGFKEGVLIYRLEGTCRGVAVILKQLFERRPVRPNTYLEFRRLKKNGPAQVGTASG